MNAPESTARAPDESTVDRLARLESNVHGMKASMDEMNQALKQIAEKLAIQQQTPWGTLIAAASILLTIVGGLGYLASQPFTRELDRIDLNQREITVLQREHGETLAVRGQQVQSNTEDVSQLGSTLQREMRLLDGAIVERLNYLDSRLQRDMELMLRPYDQRLKALEGSR